MSRFDDQQKEWIIDTVKKFGKEHVYLDKNGDWINLQDQLMAESEAKGKRKLLNCSIIEGSYQLSYIITRLR